MTAEAKLTGKTYVKKRKEAKLRIVPNHPEQPKIVSNIPAPVETRGGAREERFAHFYPFEKMKPGDSFWVPSKSGCTVGAVCKFAKRSGWKFKTRAQGEDGRANNEIRESKNIRRGIRVWRIV